jgi:thioredoxin family protein
VVQHSRRAAAQHRRPAGTGGPGGLLDLHLHQLHPDAPLSGGLKGAIGDFGITYPVAQDNDAATWSAYHNQYWPADYLIDARGRVRLVHFGEGAYAETESAIRSLLAEAGSRGLGGRAHARVERPDPHSTPETYLGAARAERFANGPILPGTQRFDRIPESQLASDQLAYGGTWAIARDSATAGKGASLELSFSARRVFLVLGSPGGPRRMRVLLDGKPVPDALAGPDVHNGVVTISSQRLYRLVDLPHPESHVLTLLPQAGVQGYAFTFG